MRLQVGLGLMCALAAGPALAQGTFSPGHKPAGTFGSAPSSSATRPSSYGVTPPAPYRAGAPATGAAARTYGAPEAPKAPGFQPAKPFAGSSTYARPSASRAPAGAKPCETSVYANACGDRR